MLNERDVRHWTGAVDVGAAIFARPFVLMGGFGAQYRRSTAELRSEGVGVICIDPRPARDTRRMRCRR